MTLDVYALERLIRQSRIGIAGNGREVEMLETKAG